MDDDTWLKVVEILAPAIRKMKGIRDHPDWYCNLMYDGFKSHVNVTRALEIFAEKKFMLLKRRAVQVIQIKAMIRCRQCQTSKQQGNS
eukprot:4618680-Ditylum_brightwellii.AAC.1